MESSYTELQKAEVYSFKGINTENLRNTDTTTKGKDDNIIFNNHKVFRFSFLALDFASLNVIYLILLQVSKGVQLSSEYLLFFFLTNIFWTTGAYITALYFGHLRFFKRTVQTFLFYFALTLFFLFIYEYDYSRFFVLVNFLGFGTSLLITRIILMGKQQFLQKEGITTKVILLGCNSLSHRLITTLSVQKKYEIHGFFDDHQEYEDGDLSYPILGRINESLSYAIKNNVTEIYSTILPEKNSEIIKIAQKAENHFIRFKFVPDLKMFMNRRVHIGFQDDIPILSLRSEPLQEIENRFKKRIFDILFGTFVIFFILSWLVPLLAVLIKLESKGPVFFKQLRSGKNNKAFLCFKFRSLRINSEANSKQVVRNDTRYTRIGKFLRKTNLDELPQFFNVLQGYMSVVGPRPHMLMHTEKYSNLMNQFMVRHFIKPGITGWAQINGYRGEIKKDEQLHKRVEHDIIYMENWSMWLDLRIIFLTIYKTIIGDKNAF